MKYLINRTFSFYGTTQECKNELGHKLNFKIEESDSSKTDFESCSGSYSEEIEITKSDYSLVSSVIDWAKEQDDLTGECFSVDNTDGTTILTEEDLCLML